jgi:hypothetical protein
MDDEPFLEDVARVDRARDVRSAACRLLDRLPASRRAQRMSARADRLLEMVHEHGVIPDLPAAWEADGIELGQGTIRTITADLLEATPLDHWGADLPRAIERIVGGGTQIMDDLFAALARAALNQRREDWILALLTAGGRHHSASLLLRAAPVPAGAAWLAGVLAKGSVLEAAANLSLARAVPRPWPAPLVAEVLRRGVDILSYGQHVPGDVTSHLHLVGERADPALLRRLVPDLAAIRSHEVRLERAFRGAHDIASLRMRALDALAPGPSTVDGMGR